MIDRKTRFDFGTKAETLKRLREVLSLSVVPGIYYFTVEKWLAAPREILGRISEIYGTQQIVVRSSAIAEDTDTSAMAGMYHSELGASGENPDQLQTAIDRVVESYRKSTQPHSEKDQVLIQRMVEDVSMSGVVFTQDMNTGAPYYVINYDDESGRTDTVTAGGRYSNRTLFVHRKAIDELHSDRFIELLRVVREIEEVTGNESLDIEFVVSEDNSVSLLQVRKITTLPNWNRGITLQINDGIECIRNFVSERLKPVPNIYGDKSILGQMPDWNPVEMLGAAPRPLSFSLYRHLITDRAWRVARSLMGYAEPHGTNLMVSLAGQPYIDVRLSFHSFLPAELDQAVAHKLVNVWLDRLSEHKDLHDKIEFEIAITALTFDFDGLVNMLMPSKLSASELEIFRVSLQELTNSLLTGRRAPIDGELNKIKSLEKRRKKICSDTTNMNIMLVAALLEDCIRLGTIPFSILARHAFIAKSFLSSLVTRRILSEDDVRSFQISIQTVAGDFVHDLEKYNADEMEAGEFFEIYGHLRPGTYDILSRRYDQREESFLSGAGEKKDRPSKDKEFSFSAEQSQKIDALLMETGFEVGPQGLISYIRKAIESREYAKFVFTRNVSDALEIIALWGEHIGLSRDELSYLTIADILNSATEAKGRSKEQHLRDKSDEARKQHEITLALKLPHLIEKVEDVSIVPLLLHRPNFITRKRVRSSTVFLDGHNNSGVDIAGKIVLIEGADPGYDWIFSHPLVGLATKYGGANSHMAIRCAEFDLPAAIGCGEQIFDRICRASTVVLNCSEERIDPVEMQYNA